MTQKKPDPKRPMLFTTKETRVQQHFKHETNVNTIVNRFKNGGGLPQGNSSQPQYIDHTQLGDYTEMLSQVTAVQQTFDRFPSQIRSKFNNNPAKYLAFLQDDKNREEAISLGLVKPPEKPDAERTGAPPPQTPSAPTEAPKPAPKTTDTNSGEPKK